MKPKRKDRGTDKKPIVPVRPDMELLYTSATRLGIFRIFGSDTLPPGFTEVKVGVVRKYYCIEVGAGPLAFRVAFKVHKSE